MTIPDLAALRALVEAAKLQRNTRLQPPEAFTVSDDWIVIPRTDFDAIRAVLPAAREALERVEKLIGLQRAALEVWKRAHPYEQCPMPESNDPMEQRAIAFLHVHGQIGWTNWVEALITLVETAEASLARLEGALRSRPSCRRCNGAGKVPSRCPDPQCGDSTWDHMCELGGYDPCPACEGTGLTTSARAALEGRDE